MLYGNGDDSGEGRKGGGREGKEEEGEEGEDSKFEVVESIMNTSRKEGIDFDLSG